MSKQSLGLRTETIFLSKNILKLDSSSTKMAELCFIEAPTKSHDSITCASLQPEDLATGQFDLIRNASGDIHLFRATLAFASPRYDSFPLAPQAVNNNSSNTLRRPVHGCHRKRVPNLKSSFPKRVRRVSGSNQVTFRAFSEAGTFQRNIPTFRLQGSMSLPYNTSLNVSISDDVATPRKCEMWPRITQSPSISTRSFTDECDVACSTSCQRHALMMKMTRSSLHSFLRSSSPIQSAAKRSPQRRIRSFVYAPLCTVAKNVEVFAQPSKHCQVRSLEAMSSKHRQVQSFKRHKAGPIKHRHTPPVPVQDCSSQLQSLIARTTQDMQRYHHDTRTSSSSTNSGGCSSSRAALYPRCGSGAVGRISHGRKRGGDSRWKSLSGQCVNNVSRGSTGNRLRGGNLSVLKHYLVTDIRRLSYHKQRIFRTLQASLLQTGTKKRHTIGPIYRLKPAVLVENGGTYNSHLLTQVDPGWNQDILLESDRFNCGGKAPAYERVGERAEATSDRVSTFEPGELQGTSPNINIRRSSPFLYNSKHSVENIFDVPKVYRIESSQHCCSKERQPVQSQALGIEQALGLGYRRPEAHTYSSEADLNKNYQAHCGGDSRQQAIVFSKHARKPFHRDSVFQLKHSSQKETQKEYKHFVIAEKEKSRKYIGLSSKCQSKQPGVEQQSSRRECESGHQRWQDGNTCFYEDMKRGASEMSRERKKLKSDQMQGRGRPFLAEATASPKFSVRENTTGPLTRQRTSGSQPVSQEDSHQRIEHLSGHRVRKRVADLDHEESYSKNNISRQNEDDTEFQELEQWHDADNKKTHFYSKEKDSRTKNERKGPSKNYYSTDYDSMTCSSTTQHRGNIGTTQGGSRGQNRASHFNVQGHGVGHNQRRNQIFLRNNSERYVNTGLEHEIKNIKHSLKIGEEDTTADGPWCFKKQTEAGLLDKQPSKVRSKGPKPAGNVRNISSIFDSSSQASWPAQSQDETLQMGTRLDKTVESLVGGMLWNHSQRLSNSGIVSGHTQDSASSDHTTNIKIIDCAHRCSQMKKDTVGTAKSYELTPIVQSDNELVNNTADRRGTKAESSRMNTRKLTNTKENPNSRQRQRRTNNSHRSIGHRRLEKDPGKFDLSSAIQSTQKTATIESMPMSGYSCPPNTDSAVSSIVDTLEDTSLYLDTQTKGSRSISISSLPSLSSNVSLYSVSCSRTSPFSTVTLRRPSTLSLTSSFQHEKDSLPRTNPSKLVICPLDIFQESKINLNNTEKPTQSINDSWSSEKIKEPESAKPRRSTYQNVPHRSFKGLPPPVPHPIVLKERRSNLAAVCSPPQGPHGNCPPRSSYHRRPRVPLIAKVKQHWTSPSRPTAINSRVLRMIPPTRSTGYAWQRNQQSSYDSPSSSLATCSLNSPRRDTYSHGLGPERGSERPMSPPSVIFDGEQISIVQIVSRSRNIDRLHRIHPDWETQRSSPQKIPPSRAGDLWPSGRHPLPLGFGSSAQSFAQMSPVSSCRGVPEFSNVTSEQHTCPLDARWPVEVFPPSSAEYARSSFVHANVHSLTADWPVGFHQEFASYEPLKPSKSLKNSRHTNARMECKLARAAGDVPGLSSHSSSYAVPLSYGREDRCHQTRPEDDVPVGSDCCSIKELALFKGQTLPSMKPRRRHAVEACNAILRTQPYIIGSEDERIQDCSSPPHQLRNVRAHDVATTHIRHSRHHLTQVRCLDSASKDSFSRQVCDGDRPPSLQHTPCTVISPFSACHFLTTSDSQQSLPSNHPFNDPCRPSYRPSSPSRHEAYCVRYPRHFLHTYLDDVQPKDPKANTRTFLKKVHDASVGAKADAMTQTGNELITDTGSPAVNHFFILPAQTQNSSTGLPQQVSEAKIITINSIGKHTQDPHRIAQSGRDVGVQTEKRTKNKKTLISSPSKKSGGKNPAPQRRKQTPQKWQPLTSGAQLQESLTRTEKKRWERDGSDAVRINRSLSTVKGRLSPANKTPGQGSSISKPGENNAAGHLKAGNASKARQFKNNTSSPAFAVTHRKASNMNLEKTQKLQTRDTSVVNKKGNSASLKPRSIFSPVAEVTQRLVSACELVIPNVQFNPSHSGKNSDQGKKPEPIAVPKKITNKTTIDKGLLFSKKYSNSSKNLVHPKLLTESGKSLSSQKIIEQVALRRKDALSANKTFNRCLDITPISDIFQQDAAALLSNPCPGLARLQIPGHIHLSRSENVTEMCDIYQRISPKPTSRTGPGYSTSRAGPGYSTSRTGLGHSTSRTGPGYSTSRTGLGHSTSRTGLGHTTSRTGPGYLKSRRSSGYPTFDSMSPTGGRKKHMLAHNPQSPRDCNIADYRQAYQQPCVDIMRIVLYPKNHLRKKKSARNASSPTRGRALVKESRGLSTRYPSNKNHLNIKYSHPIRNECTVPANTHRFKHDFQSRSPQKTLLKEFTKGSESRRSQVHSENTVSHSMSMMEVSPFSLTSSGFNGDKLSQNSSFYQLKSSSLDDKDIVTNRITIRRKAIPRLSPEGRSLDPTSQPEPPSTSLILNRGLPRTMTHIKSLLPRYLHHGDSEDDLPARPPDDKGPPNLLSQCSSLPPCPHHRPPSRTSNGMSSCSSDVFHPSLYLDTSDDVSASAVFDTSTHLTSPSQVFELISPTPHHKPINPTPHHQLTNPTPHHKSIKPTPHHKPIKLTSHHQPINPTPQHNAHGTYNQS